VIDPRDAGQPSLLGVALVELATGKRHVDILAGYFPATKYR
jgi:hypothetical protein